MINYLALVAVLAAALLTIIEASKTEDPTRLSVSCVLFGVATTGVFYFAGQVLIS